MRSSRTFGSALIFFGMLGLVQASTAQTRTNPFFNEFQTPFQAPPFEEIKASDFLPAFERAIDIQKKNIEGIVNQKAEPDFENTIVAFEKSGRELDKVSAVFFNLTSANTNSELEEIALKVSPLLSQHADDIYLNNQLFARVEAVKNRAESRDLNQEDERLLEKIYKAFVRSGARLSAKDQKKMRQINSELSVATVQFGQNVLAETNEFELVVSERDDLSGLPESLIQAAAQSAASVGKKDVWRFTLHNASVMPFLEYADRRELRKQMYTAYTMRGNQNNKHDNNRLIEKIVRLRAQRAELLGYKNHAEYVLEENMTNTPEKVYRLLDQMWAPALKMAKREKEEMQELMNGEGIAGELQPWDWFYYANKVKQKRYAFNAEELRPYFSLENVKQGIFEVVQRLYGLHFERTDELPVYHPDVQSYQVLFENGEIAGFLYMDFHSRSSKRGGAWMTSYRKQSVDESGRVLPIISIVCNFSSPNAPGEPALLTPSEVNTFFHEFGHALHGLLSQVRYNMLSGTAVPRDFVELPSQIMENWCFEPQVLELYAKHYQTDELIPAEYVEKLKNSSYFNQGFQTVEYLAASYLDMAYHTLPASKTVEPKKLEAQEMKRIGLIPQIAPRYRSTYFQHIFAGGYSAGYYSYIWSEVLDKDAFAFFKESGDLFNRELADRFRQSILEKGGTERPEKMYFEFRGADPEVIHLLKSRGLADTSEAR